MYTSLILFAHDELWAAYLTNPFHSPIEYFRLAAQINFNDVNRTMTSSRFNEYKVRTNGSSAFIKEIISVVMKGLNQTIHAEKNK